MSMMRFRLRATVCVTSRSRSKSKYLAGIRSCTDVHYIVRGQYVYQATPSDAPNQRHPCKWIQQAPLQQSWHLLTDSLQLWLTA